jgi:hypothetical protein
MSHNSAIPRPALGTIFVRKNLNGNEEEAMLVNTQWHPSGNEYAWQGVLATRNGFEFVSGTREYRNAHDWTPKGWSLNEEDGSWTDKKTVVAVDETATSATAKRPVTPKLPSFASTSV